MCVRVFIVFLVVSSGESGVNCEVLCTILEIFVWEETSYCNLSVRIGRVFESCIGFRGIGVSFYAAI